MQTLMVLRRAPSAAMLTQCLHLLQALSAARFNVNGVFLLGEAVALAHPDCTLAPKAVLLNWALEQKLMLYCCGRAAAQHGVDVNQLTAPFVPGGYFKLLTMLQDSARLVEI